MITDQMKNAITNHYEFIRPEMRPDWYEQMNEIMDYQKLSFKEVNRRRETWTAYYTKVREESPASHLFEEWKLWTRNKSAMSKEQLQDATKDMITKGLPEIQGRPLFKDPVGLEQIARQIETAGQGLLKRQDKKSKKWEE